MLGGPVVGQACRVRGESFGVRAAADLKCGDMGRRGRPRRISLRRTTNVSLASVVLLPENINSQVAYNIFLVPQVAYNIFRVRMNLCFLCFSSPPPACGNRSCNICPKLTVGDLPDGYVHICSECHAHKFGFDTGGSHTATTVATLCLPCRPRVVI